MRSRQLLFIAIISLIFIFGYLAIFPTNDITGKSVSSFSATATITSITIDIDDFVQQQPAIVNGSNITMNIPVTYSGQGTSAISVPIPTGYLGATNWIVIENGINKSVSENSTHLNWTANFSAQNTIIQCIIAAPTITIINTTNSTTEYDRRVRISAPNHFNQVSVTIPIDGTYPHYRLYEVDNGLIDRTQDYHFTLNTTHASWSGFTLSTKDFIIDGTTTLPTTEQEYKRRRVQWPPRNISDISNKSNESEPIQTPVVEQPSIITQRFLVQPREFKLKGTTGTKQIVEIVLINNLDEPITFSVKSDDGSIIPATSSILVEHTITVPITVMIQNKHAVLSISDGITHTPVYFDLEALPKLPAQKELPAQLQGTWSITRIINGMLAIILLGILVLATLQRRLLHHADK